MNVKGFLMEDDHGQEFVVVCEQPDGRPGQVFALRGWQRRRMVPLHCTGRDRLQIAGQVLMTLDDLFHGLSNVCVDPLNLPLSPSEREGIHAGDMG